MTKYYQEKYQDSGISIIPAQKLRIDKKAVFKLINENWVTTSSNVISWIIGLGSVALMVL